MPFYGEAVDGPAVLQLQKWGPSQFQLKPSEFLEASISPTRKLLLLLSYHCEALLIPLLSGSASSHMLMNGDDSVCFFPKTCSETTSSPLYSREQADVPCASEHADIESRTASASNCYPIFPDVKSSAWGHFGDEYTQIDDPGFRELLIVSGDNGVIVHGFRCMDKSTRKFDSAPEDGSVCGKWVEWGPSYTTQLKEQFLSDFGSFESLHHRGSMKGTTGKINTNGDFGDPNTFDSSFMHKKWFQSFLAELDTSLCGGKYMTKFPKRSSLPQSAEVVSFSIYDSTLKFLAFLSSSNNVDKKENRETAPRLEGEVAILASPKISSPKESLSCEEGLVATRIPYKCLRVFSSSSFRYIGLVFTFSEDASTNSCEGFLSDASKILVVVIMLHKWGMEWLCSVDLQELYPGPGPGPQWADFQFSDNFLVSLSTAGLICLWSTKNGKLVAHFDVLHTCGLNSKVHSELDWPKEVVNANSASLMTNFEQEADQSNKVYGKETYARDTIYMGTFKRLMVASHSLLLACVDEYGVIYVIRPDDYILTDRYAFDKLMPTSQQSDVGMPLGWKIAGHEIGVEKELSEFSNGKGFNVSETLYGGSSNIKQVKEAKLKKSGSQLDTYLSGFATGSQVKELPYSKSNRSSTPLRRIFLPLNRYKKEESICFSPFGITRLIRSCNLEKQKTCAVVHTCLHIVSSVLDERDLPTCLSSSRKSVFVGESIGCSFQGSLYLVTQDGLSVILPPVSVSSSLRQVESIKYWQPNTVARSKYQMKNLVEMNECKKQWSPWQIEVLDRALLYEGSEEARHMCSENGWDLKIARVRQLDLALHYLKSDEIEKSLDLLVHVNLAEEGILRLLFTSVYEIFCKVGGEKEVALASRLLSLAACFATKMVRRYGLVEHKKGKFISSVKKDVRSHLQPILPRHNLVDISNSRRLCEMSQFLEVVRNLQSRMAAKNKVLDGRDAATRVGTDVKHDDSLLPIMTMGSISSVSLDALQLQDMGESDVSGPESTNETAKSDLPLLESSVDALSLLGNSANEIDAPRRRALPLLEKSRDMILRWGIANLDLKTVVKDALNSGRLPLAVLQLHIQRQRELDSEKESHDTFCEIRDIGRTIAYDLFLKGESGLAVEILRRLGEDIEIILRELLLGTVRRSLRGQIAREMKKYGYLRPHEWKKLERIYLIERLYPSSSFWGTLLGRQKNTTEAASSYTLPEASSLKMVLHMYDNLTIECGEVDGVVIGPWANADGCSSSPSTCEDNIDAGYWACAAVWSDAWDNRTMDRIVLDQPFHLGVHVPWESQFEYHMTRNELAEVCKLLDVIPTSLLSEKTLNVNLNDSTSATIVGGNANSPDHALYICAAEELEAVCMDVANIKIFRSPAAFVCSSWLKMHVEEELARKYIFLQEYWGSAAEIMPLLARAGLIINVSGFPRKATASNSSTELSIPNITEEYNEQTAQAFHRLVVHYCMQCNLPNLLDLYLDHHNLGLNEESLSALLEAAGNCHWARWLLLSRIKGHEYEASLSNARSNLSRQMIPGCNLSVLDIDEIVHTVDDMAEGAGEMAALATLMYAVAPMQRCVCTGSVNRNCRSSSQCTLENLRPGLQRFPTLWRTLIAACFGQDLNGCLVGSNAVDVYGKPPFSHYLSWRESMFFSAGGDTSLIQMLPCWFSKSIRRLIKLFVQGPLGWQMSPGGESFLHKDGSYIFNINRYAGFNAVSWEASIQKGIEEELHSSLEENGTGVEHHLHRGRALAAFSYLLGARAQKLKSASVKQELHGQTNAQSDVQMLLAPLTQSEGSLLSSVAPLAIMHFEDSILVASCAFLLELCGLSASILRVDIAVLHCILSYYDSIEETAPYELVSPKGSVRTVSHAVELTASLARALADAYIHHDHLKILEKDFPPKTSSDKQPPRSLTTVLQHLEKASLPVMEEGKTCGSWLSSGSGDGSEFRSQQKDASQRWNLVTTFCQIHHLPLSTKYLALLANDNDWVGFLTEAQLGGFPLDVTIQVAAKEFSDPRLKTHILTVLKTMQLTKKKSSSSTSTSSSGEKKEFSISKEIVPVELFGLLAECEKQKNPGEALLTKAKDLHWPVLAIIASCFPDVSPLPCLTVWLEITASRETSSIKVNDIYAKIASSVGAAVETTNMLPPGSRTVTFRYNRKNPKRRHLVDPSSANSSVDATFNFVNDANPTIVSIAQEISIEDGGRNMVTEQAKLSCDSDEGLALLSTMVAVLCEQHLFLPLLRAFEMFLPSCSLLPFVRFLQAFSQMRLSEASAHLASFSARIKEEPFHTQIATMRGGSVRTAWISSTAVKAAEAMLSTCPSAYEKRCLLHLLAAIDFGDGGSAATYFRRLYWKINLAEPSLRRDNNLYLGDETLDDASLLTALEKHGHWDEARNWARQLESSGASWKSAVHHVTEKQAEAMVAEWKEFLWDIPQERAALWNHCQTLFLRHSFPALQAGLFFLKHAEETEKDISARELHEMLLLSLQWLSGTISQSNPVYPLHLLREIETRVWLLAVESEAQSKVEGDFATPTSIQNLVGGNSASIIEHTASIITKMDDHINAVRAKATERNGTRENNLTQHRHFQTSDSNSLATTASSSRTKRRAKTHTPLRRPVIDGADSSNDSDDYANSPNNFKSSSESSRSSQLQEENAKIEVSVSGWEEKVKPAELERAVLSLLEFGQIVAAKQLQQKLSPTHIPSELVIVDAALNLAALSSSCSSGEISDLALDPEVLSVIQSSGIPSKTHMIDALQALEALATKCGQGCGRGLCRRIIAVVNAAKVLGIQFSEAFEKRPIELLQLLSLKAQDSLEEAKLLVQTHIMPPPSIARILAESFLKGLLAAHRGGYMDSQKEEGPAPLLWRFSDFLKWAELCPSESEIGHALMRLVMTGQDIPHACEVELLILSHHFYKSSACLDGVDVLVTLAANRVESYVLEGDFSCLARLVTGVSNFHALNFILNILIENGQLELLLQKYSTAETATGTDGAVRGFRMAVLTSLKLFNPHDLDAFAMVYNHFDMKHETASLLESRSMQHIEQWHHRRGKDRQHEDLVEAMRYLIEAAEVHSTIDAGHKTHHACDRAFLLSLQIRIPDFQWLDLSETNARRALVEQSRFQEALIVAEAYNLNQPSEWALVLWNQMLKPDLIEQFVAEFVAVLPLQPSMLLELVRFYRAEVAARGDQSHFSVWLSPGGLPAEWVKHLGRSFRSLLKRTRDFRLRVQLATIATGFGDVIDVCMKVLDKVPDNVGPLILRKGHGGAYIPLM